MFKFRYVIYMYFQNLQYETMFAFVTMLSKKVLQIIIKSEINT